MSLRIGLDVGGTNTDAVVLDHEDRLVAKAKRPTTPDVTVGLLAALDAVLGAVEPAAVTRIMLGTTHATNAILERRGLGRVAVIRLGAPATTSVPPLSDWPDDLRATVSAGEAVLPGGHFVDGYPISALDLGAVRRFLDGRDAGAVAVTGVFSPASAEQEQAVAELVTREYGLPVSLSHELGSLGLLERENATVLNAALYGVAERVTGALTSALESRGLSALPYLAQNDGTLMTLEQARRLPVSTIGSGPANSLRGAAFLSGAQDAIVADVGGTSTDLGVLVGGFPRESTAATEIGGVLTNFRMPDILAIALGGGSIVGPGPSVGPESVGYRIAELALAFGGGVPTLTDAGILAGRAQELGGAWKAGEFELLLSEALKISDAMVEDAVDRMTLGRTGRPLVAVGGGAFLLPASIPGVSDVLRPRHAEVANAVGAAIALASGRVDTILPAGQNRAERIEAAKTEAAARAVQAGADPGGVEIVDLYEIPLSYLSEPAVRLHVKAAGPLKPNR
ncbi:hydantoinase/oxoprolinase family protein [Nonomuraea soli]|uniref:N-methylhydantoinase A/oxoprolinase/acetone carboxylase beta subunit n=1 Tax=Nonomuraea soli TaxID=1032476 RepID=A0A7W0CLT5_9ACTN|nr:hydantoinase/oxoprolinase family protein [Nonomuraea soli]MBA2893563.1 N-methylhydantoinase A/oxoprolinase/acetone carboxylase beta subunit [Nonomuraea soli]